MDNLPAGLCLTSDRSIIIQDDYAKFRPSSTLEEKNRCSCSLRERLAPIEDFSWRELPRSGRNPTAWWWPCRGAAAARVRSRFPSAFCPAAALPQNPGCETLAAFRLAARYDGSGGPDASLRRR